MIMDVKDTDSDLQALKRLYGLLKKDGEGTSYAASDLLDDRARLLLKNLLDEATKRLLQIPPSDEEQPSTLPKLSKNAAQGTQSDKDIRKEKRLTQTQSKRCRICQKDTIKQLESIEEPQFYDAVQHPDIVSEDQQNDESDHYLWNSQQKTGMSGEVDCLSEEASKAIQQIDLCISAFHSGADDDHHLQKVNKFHGPNVVIDNFEPGNWIMSQNVFLPTRFHNVQDFGCPATYSSASKIGSSYERSRWDRHRGPKIMREITLDEKPSRLLVGPCFQEKDGIPNTDFSSSYSRSQQSRSGDSDSDSQENSFSSMSSENVYSSYTSNSGNDDEVYSSSTSGEAAREVTSISSSKIIKHKKVESGVWRKLKDKLAVIFHHHHHHHHHHRNPNNRNTSLRKHKGELYNFKRQGEVYGERAVEKARKSLIHEKNQQNHFHGLVEGLMRHVKNSKKPKRGKEAVVKKRLKKSHWWQLMQQHRRGGGANITHVKLGGLGKKRTRLKALPRPK